MLVHHKLKQKCIIKSDSMCNCISNKYCTFHSLTRGLAVSENISEDEDPESESVLGIVPHQVCCA